MLRKGLRKGTTTCLHRGVGHQRIVFGGHVQSSGRQVHAGLALGDAAHEGVARLVGMLRRKVGPARAVGACLEAVLQLMFPQAINTEAAWS